MKINKMSDEQCLNKFLEFLKERVILNTVFVVDPETDNLTHQILHITCGEYISVSDPEPLSNVLRFATGEEQGATIN